MPVGPKMIVVAKRLALGLPMIQLFCNIRSELRSPATTHAPYTITTECLYFRQDVYFIMICRLLDDHVHLTGDNLGDSTARCYSHTELTLDVDFRRAGARIKKSCRRCRTD
jgi:hypothetical protein